MKFALFSKGKFSRPLLASIAVLPALVLHAAPPPAITPIPAQSVPCGKSLVVPVAADGNGPLTFTVKSNNPKVLPQVRTGGPFLKIHVDYAGDGGASLPFSGDMVFELFRDFTPKTVGFIAGFAQAGFYNNATKTANVAATFATLPTGSGPSGLTLDGSSNLYVALNKADQIGVITSGGTTVSLFATLPAGSGPSGLVFDGSGNLYVADSKTDQISKITPDGTVTHFALLPVSSGPTGLAFDGSGNLYVAEYNSDHVSVIISGGTAASLFATLPPSSGPSDLAFDGSGNLYVTDYKTDQISEIISGGTTANLFATLPTGSGPSALAFDSSGNLYVANNTTNLVSSIASDGTVSRYAPLSSGSGPSGLVFDAMSGTPYVADNTTDQISSITMDVPFNSMTFHRVTSLTGTTSGFIAQGGDPDAQNPNSGTDTTLLHGPGFSFDNEFSAPLILDGKGQLAMANGDGTSDYMGTNGSQFFITQDDSLRYLDFNHTIFGQLIRGSDVLDKINAVPTDSNSKPLVDVVMTNVSVIEDNTDAVLLLSAIGTTGTNNPANMTLVATDALGRTGTASFAVNAVVDTVNDPPIILSGSNVFAALDHKAFVHMVPQDLEFDYLFPSAAFVSNPYSVSGNYSSTDRFGIVITPNSSNPTGSLVLGTSVSQYGTVLRSDASDRTSTVVGLGTGRMTPLPIVLQAIPGTPIADGIAATFSDADPRSKPTDFSVTINWGDGTPLTTGSDATVARASQSGPGAFNVTAPHTYPSAGIYPLVVTIDDPFGAVVVARNWAVVTGDALVVAGNKLRTATGLVSSRTMATFTDTSSKGQPANYSASINWGDGQTSEGTIRGTAAGFNVGGLHKYAANGSYAITTTINKASPAATATGWGAADVSGAARWLPPFAQSHLVAQVNSVSLTPPSSVTAQVLIINCGNLPAKNASVKFYISNDATLDSSDIPLKVGTQNALALAPLGAGKSISGTLPNLVYPAGTAHTGKYLLMELVNPDPIAAGEKYDRVFTYSPLP